MKMTIGTMMAREMFRNYDRDYYTTTGIEAILDYFDEVDPDAEFDVIGICCDWSEYGDGATLTFSDFLNDFEYLKAGDEDFENLDKDDKINALFEEIENHTYIIRLENGNILLQVF